VKSAQYILRWRFYDIILGMFGRVSLYSTFNLEKKKVSLVKIYLYKS